MWQGNKLDQFEQFYEDHKDADGNLSEEDNARMSMLAVEGDTGVKPDGNVPDVALPTDTTVATVVVPTPAIAEPAEPVPVLLAKDGVHTIGYEKLVEARESAKHWEQVAAAAAAEVEALKKAPAATVAAVVPDPEVVAPVDGLPADVFGDYSEEALAKGVNTLVDAKVAVISAALEAKFATALAPAQKQAEVDAADAHYRPIYTAHPDVESVVESAEMKAFLDKQPSFTRAAYEAVLAEGTSAQVIELLDLYRSVNPRVAVLAPVSAAAKAKEIVAAAKSAAPTSLTDIPGGAAHHDEIGAIREMGDAALMTKFEGKSSEQILALLNRVI
jgi:hypothetical protein